MPSSNRSYRFSVPSDFIDITQLERESRKLLFLGVVVAVSFHAALGSYFMFRGTEVKVVKPPTMELVIRRPRMTKPFEFKKQRLKKRELSRKTFVAMGRPDITLKVKGTPDIVPGKIMAYDYKYEPGTGAEDYYYIPEKIDIDMKVLRKPTNQISMKEELISIDDLDTGRYKGLVIRDPNDKQNIRGFIYLGLLWGTEFDPPVKFRKLMVRLSEAVNRYTKIQSKFDNHLYIDSPRLFITPFVYICTDKIFELTPTEAHCFGDYLRKGGFAVLDNGEPWKEFSSGEASLRKMLQDSLGQDARFLPIPNSHPLYHCFFDFDDGPPTGAEMLNGYSETEQIFYLEGIWIKERLVAVYSDKGYGINWMINQDNEPQLKMGVNFVVFALTQEGGIAQRYMEKFSSAQ